MSAWKVNAAVGNVRNNTPDLLAPMTAEGSLFKA